MSSDLKWNIHLKFIASRAYKVLRRSFSSGLDTKANNNLYILLIRSQLSYIRFTDLEIPSYHVGIMKYNLNNYI